MSDFSSCQLSSCIELGCIGSVGGIKTVYATTAPITGITYNSSNQITGITGNGVIYQYEVEKQTSSLTETFNNSLENGTLFYNQDAVLAFNKIDIDKRNQMRLLAQNRNIKLFVEDNNGNIYFLGGDFNGGYVSAGSSSTGTAFGDKNAYDITLQFFSKDPMTLLSGSISSTISGGLSLSNCA